MVTTIKSKSEMYSICNDPSKQELKEKIQAMVVSYLFMFLEKELEIGAGDIAASSKNLPTGLEFTSKIWLVLLQPLYRVWFWNYGGMLP